MPKNKTVIIDGVAFRPGQLDWEDATGSRCAALPKFADLRMGKEYAGRQKTSIGLIARIGRYLVVISECDEISKEYDYTLVPVHAKTEIRYS